LVNKRLKLWLVTKQFAPILGGAPERFKRYAPGFRDRGVDIEVYTSSEIGLDKFEMIEKIKVNRVEVKNVNENYIELLNFVQNQISKKSKPDLIIFFSSYPKIFFKMLRFRLAGIKLIFVCTMVIEAKPKNLINKLKNIIYHKISFMLMNKIIASSKIMKSSLVHNGFDSKKIDIIPNGVDINRFRPFTSNERKINKKKEMRFKEEEKIVIFVGFFTRRKGADLLIDAWSKVIKKESSAKLLIVGPYKPSKANTNYEKSWFDLIFYENIKKTIKNNKLSDSITFTNEVTEVQEYFKISDIFVFPSRKEGMGNVVCEAMATGLPCILTPYIGLPDEFGTPGEEYILSSSNSSSIAKELLKLMNDKTLRSQIGFRGLKKIMSMDLTNSLNKYVEVFFSLKNNK
jgi:glycosyltransferase involved in cell wall biosynthesis